MPTVPEATNRVGIASVTGEKLQPQDLSGTGLSAVGAGLEQVAQAGDQYAKQLQHTQNLYDDAAVKSAQNTYTYGTRAILHQGDDAFYGKVGFGAGDALQPTQDALTKARDDARGMLKSDRQRELFDHAITNRYTSDLADTSDFAHRQVKVEQNTQNVAVQANSAQDAVMNYNNPDRREAAIATGLAAIHTLNIGQGHGDKWEKNESLKFTSGIHTAQINSLMTSDPVSASALFNEKRGEMTTADQLATDRGLHGPMVERQGDAVAAQARAAVMGAASTAGSPPGAATTTAVPSFTAPIAKLQAVVAHNESQNRDFTNGHLTTSSKGAEGRMQVIPTTQTDPGYGVKPAADHSPEEIARVGNDYAAALYKKYGGDVARTLAAYNAGPGSPSTPRGLYAAEANAKAAGHPEAWLSYLPKETQSYVATGTHMLGGAVASNAAPNASNIPTKDNIAAIYANIKAQHLPYDVEKSAMASADRDIGRDDRIVTQTQDNAYDNATRTKIALGNNFTSIHQIDPRDLQNMRPEHYGSLVKEAEQNAKPAPIPADGDTIMTLDKMAVLEKDKFMHRNLSIDKPSMTPGEFARISNLQTKMIAKPDDPVDVTHSILWNKIRQDGPMIGIDMRPQGKIESAEAFKARRQDAQRAFSTFHSVITAITKGERQPTGDEVNKAWDNTIMTKAGPNGEAIPRFRMDGPVNSVAIPQAMHDRIRDNLKALRQPYDDQSVARFYIATKR